MNMLPKAKVLANSAASPSHYLLEHREGDSEAELSCDIGQRVSCGLTSQSGAPRETGIHLNDVVLGDKHDLQSPDYTQ